METMLQQDHTPLVLTLTLNLDLAHNPMKLFANPLAHILLSNFYNQLWSNTLAQPRSVNNKYNYIQCHIGYLP